MKQYGAITATREAQRDPRPRLIGSRIRGYFRDRRFKIGGAYAILNALLILGLAIVAILTPMPLIE